MAIRVVERSPLELGEYGQVRIAFEVASRLRLDELKAHPEPLTLVEDPVRPAWVKDYDAIHGEGPTRWARRWDLSHWGVLVAFEGATRLGGAVIAWDTPGVDMLEGRRDLAVLWDLRVRPEARRRGIGTRLFAAAVQWATGRGCRELRVETQDINVAACRFYAGQGCTLLAVRPHAYDECPDEAQLIWGRSLTGRD